MGPNDGKLPASLRDPVGPFRCDLQKSSKKLHIYCFLRFRSFDLLPCLGHVDRPQRVRMEDSDSHNHHHSHSQSGDEDDAEGDAYGATWQMEDIAFGSSLFSETYSVASAAQLPSNLQSTCQFGNKSTPPLHAPSPSSFANPISRASSPPV